MLNVEIPDELWGEISAQKALFNFPTQVEFLKFCLDATQTRYGPAVAAIVTRNDHEILLVGNDYGREELIWNLPGGAVDPGENLIQAVARELYEETGITALEIGPLAWIVQVVLNDQRPFIIDFAFEIASWEGDVSLENEVEQGHVQQAAFVSFDEARECVFTEFQTTLHDWLDDPSDTPRIYFSTNEGVRRVK
jgi:ADP-ribose pyrophosphatase YjhB (NUDIX family)